MDSFADVKGEFVERSQKTEELGEPGANSNGEESVPDEKPDNGVFGDFAFFPSDLRMSDVGDDGCDDGGDKSGEPEKIIISENKISQNRIESKIEDGDSDTDEEISSGVLASFDILGLGGSSRLCGVAFRVL